MVWGIDSPEVINSDSADKHRACQIIGKVKKQYLSLSLGLKLSSEKVLRDILGLSSWN